MESRAIEQRLRSLRAEVASARPAPRAVPAARPARRSMWTRALLGVLKVTLVVALPFVVYARGAVTLHHIAGLPPWIAVAGAALMALVVAAGYASWLARRVSRNRIAPVIGRWVVLPTAVAWCAYSALYLARVNAKTDDVRSYYASVHPVLRVAIATAILGDPALVVTDARRVPEDYRRMGLPVNDRTRHYRQSDGWVHAVDLRTNGRSAARNLALELYFRAMGFRTLRHVGTADHLHVQLSLPPHSRARPHRR